MDRDVEDLLDRIESQDWLGEEMARAREELAELPRWALPVHTGPYPDPGGL